MNKINSPFYLFIFLCSLLLWLSCQTNDESLPKAPNEKKILFMYVEPYTGEFLRRVPDANGQIVKKLSRQNKVLIKEQKSFPIAGSYGNTYWSYVESDSGYAGWIPDTSLTGNPHSGICSLNDLRGVYKRQGHGVFSAITVSDNIDDTTRSSRGSWDHASGTFHSLEQSEDECHLNYTDYIGGIRTVIFKKVNGRWCAQREFFTSEDYCHFR